MRFLMENPKERWRWIGLSIFTMGGLSTGWGRSFSPLLVLQTTALRRAPKMENNPARGLLPTTPGGDRCGLTIAMMKIFGCKQLEKVSGVVDGEKKRLGGYGTEEFHTMRTK